jgi:hypothetical protein
VKECLKETDHIYSRKYLRSYVGNIIPKNIKATFE